MAVLVAVLVALAGCGGDGATGGRPPTPTPTGATGAAPPLSGTLTVLAAASLADSFGELGRRFEADHPGLTVAFNLAASSSLSRQLVEGAPGDVLAAADEVTMQQAVDAGAVDVPDRLRPQPAGDRRPRRQPRGDRRAGRPGPARPGGGAVRPRGAVRPLAAETLGRAGVGSSAGVVGGERRAVLAKVTLGEADAGIVYVTDVLAVGDKVAGVVIPDAAQRGDQLSAGDLDVGRQPDRGPGVGRLRGLDRWGG